MSSPALRIETIIAAILTEALPTAEIQITSTDASTVSRPNRITVTCQPEVGYNVRSDMKTPKEWKSDVTITAQTNASLSTFDDWREKIDLAINPTSDAYSAAIQTLATTAFPNGLEIGYLNGGSVEFGDQRTLTRTFGVIFKR